MEKLTKEQFIRLTSEEFKACAGCMYRFKDKGFISRQHDEPEGVVYGCRIGEMSKLIKEVIVVPETCKNKNFIKKEYVEVEKLPKETDNCRICTMYMDYKPVCKDERIKVTYCPCKYCPDFMVNYSNKCLHYSWKCRDKMKFEVVKEEDIKQKE